jgi:CrcB protein
MYESLVRYLAIAVAGSAGAVLRYVLGSQIGKLNLRFPLATFIINITGSLFLVNTRLAIAVGFVGAYTTFSTFMYESNLLIDEKAWLEATANLVGSLIVGLLAVRVGMMLAR